jgi:hypothetical protein
MCKDCGKHFVAMMRWKADQEAQRMSREALGMIREDGTESKEKIRELTRECHLVQDSCNGFCRPCAVVRGEARTI